MQLTKTTTRAFAASLALVAAGGTMAGAAVFHLPILGINGAAASGNVASQTAKPAVPVARKEAHRKVVVKTRFADVVVHVPAPQVRTAGAAANGTAPRSEAPRMEPTSSTAPGNSTPVITAPKSDSTTTTTMSTPTTAGGHDHEGETEDSGHEHEDAPEVPEHQGATTTTTTVVQP